MGGLFVLSVDIRPLMLVALFAMLIAPVVVFAETAAEQPSPASQPAAAVSVEKAQVDSPEIVDEQVEDLQELTSKNPTEKESADAAKLTALPDDEKKSGASEQPTEKEVDTDSAIVDEQVEDLKQLTTEKPVEQETKSAEPAAEQPTKQTAEPQKKAPPVKKVEEEKRSSSPFKNDKVQMNIYGQVNRALLWVNDGNQSEFYNVDNDHSSTRLGFSGKALGIEGYVLGVKIEVEYQSNPSNKVSQVDQNVDGEVNKRLLDVYIDSNKWGKLSLGYGSTASDHSSEVDFSGTMVIGQSRIEAFSGGQLFYDSRVGELSTTTIADVFSNMDGLGRNDRVRYDSPTLGGFVVSGSVLSSSSYDMAMRYLIGDDYKFGGAVAYSKPGGDSSVEHRGNTSASLRLQSGLNFTIAFGFQSYISAGRDDGKFVYGKVGYRVKRFALGETAFSCDLMEEKGIARNDDQASTIGFQAVQNIKKWHTQVYAGFRNHKLDRSGYKDINTMMSGLRVSF